MKDATRKILQRKISLLILVHLSKSKNKTRSWRLKTLVRTELGMYLSNVHSRSGMQIVLRMHHIKKARRIYVHSQVYIYITQCLFCGGKVSNKQPMYHAAVHMTLLKWYTGGEINEDREDSNIFISSQFSYLLLTSHSAYVATSTESHGATLQQF